MDPGNRHFGDKNFSAPGQDRGIEDELYGLREIHNEPGHVDMRQGDRPSIFDLAVEDGKTTEPLDPTIFPNLTVVKVRLAALF